MNPEATELTLPPLKRDYLGRADSMLLHRLGGDPLAQETLRLWDSGLRLGSMGEAVYLGQIAAELMVQRMGLFSYWSAIPATQQSLQQFQTETAGLQSRRVNDSLLLIRVIRDPENGVAPREVPVDDPAGR